MPLLAVLAILCAAWAGVASVAIARDLAGRGHKVSIVWLRVMILRYLHEYSKVTREETGKVGPLFYHYVVPLNVALVLVIILAVTRW